MENHNAEIRARKLREWFSTGFLKPVISTALSCFAPFRRVHRHLADASESPVPRRFSRSDRFVTDFRATAAHAQAAGAISRRCDLNCSRSMSMFR